MATQIAATTPSVSDFSPEDLRAAGVPFPLARWYHLVGRRLTRFTDWDIERIMQVRLCVAQSGF